MQDYNNANNLWYSLLSRWFSFKLMYSTIISETVPQEKSAVKCFTLGHSEGLSVTLHFTGSPALLRALATCGDIDDYESCEVLFTPHCTFPD